MKPWCGIVDIIEPHAVQHMRRTRSIFRVLLVGGADYHHRYSDDLDFFVNADAEYAAQLDIVFDKLRDDGFFWDVDSDFISAKGFTSLKVRWNKSDTVLKLDFVNDVAPHFGDVIKTALFDRADSIRNMLSNKLTALFPIDRTIRNGSCSGITGSWIRPIRKISPWLWAPGCGRANHPIKSPQVIVPPLPGN